MKDWNDPADVHLAKTYLQMSVIAKLSFADKGKSTQSGHFGVLVDFQGSLRWEMGEKMSLFIV